jgi:hypothetical protein
MLCFSCLTLFARNDAAPATSPSHRVLGRKESETGLIGNIAKLCALE